jgi:archaellum component FlaC
MDIEIMQNQIKKLQEDQIDIKKGIEELKDHLELLEQAIHELTKAIIMTSPIIS